MVMFSILVVFVSLLHNICGLGLQSCCESLGCFSATDKPFYDLIHRPISLVPNCAIMKSIYLRLSTRRNALNTDILNPYNATSVNSSHFSFDKSTKFIIHGFLDNYNYPWDKRLAGALLQEDDFNVIVVDWSAGNVPPYSQAVANTRIIAAYLAKLVSMLRDVFGYSPAKVHMIGHSLGAHIAGYVGKAVVGLGRVSGMDPAGPFFDGMDEAARLGPHDAIVVDTLISDAPLTIGHLSYGSLQPFGRLNFFANGGGNQPGCSLGPAVTAFNPYAALDTITTGVGDLVACSHLRAVNLYSESVSNKNCMMIGVECSSYTDFKTGKCTCNFNHTCSAVGFRANLSLALNNPNKNYSFYFTTNAQSPFCISS